MRQFYRRYESQIIMILIMAADTGLFFLLGEAGSRAHIFRPWVLAGVICTALFFAALTVYALGDGAWPDREKKQ